MPEITRFVVLAVVALIIVVEAPPLKEARPATDRTPVNVAGPAKRVVTEVLPRVAAPALSDIRLPTDVKEEEVIPEPRVVEVKTSVPAIWYLV